MINMIIPLQEQHAQNTTIALSVMQIKGSHLVFYIDIIVIFQNYNQK